MSEVKQRILIIDDSPMICKIVETSLADQSLQVVCAYNAEAAVNILKQQTFDLILLDVILPDSNGYDFCSFLKRQETLKDIPILFLTSRSDVKEIEKGFLSGGSDYILKPFSMIELKVRIQSHLKHKRDTDLLKQMNQMLQEAIKENQRIAMTDALTKLCNRSYFNKHLISQIKLSKVQQTSFSLLFCDIDDFKVVNDTYGHSVGDIVLTKMAELMNECVPEHAKVARWGGEEFAILLSNTSLAHASSIAEHLRQSVYSRPLIRNHPEVKLSLTIALLEYDNRYTIDENMMLVDKALYEGKAKGKNCCIVTSFSN